MISDKDDTISLFVWKNSFSEEYESGMEVNDEVFGISYQFMTNKNFKPKDEFMKTFSKKEKERVLTLVEERGNTIQYEQTLIRKEWGLW